MIADSTTMKSIIMRDEVLQRKLVSELQRRTTQIKEWVENCKSLQQCLQKKRLSMKTLSSSTNCSLDIWTQKLETLAQYHGLKYGRGKSGEIYLSCDTFYLEFILCKNGEGIEDVRFRDHSEQIRSLPGLAELVVSGDMSQLQVHLTGLSNLNNICTELKQKTKVIQCLTVMEQDLYTLSLPQMDPIHMVQMGSVGYIRPRLGGRTTRLTWYICPYDLLNPETNQMIVAKGDDPLPPGLGFSSTITIEMCRDTYKYQTTPLVMIDPVRLTHALTSQPTTFFPLNALFYLTLDKPIILTKMVAQQISSKCNVKWSDAFEEGNLMYLILRQAVEEDHVVLSPLALQRGKNIHQIELPDGSRHYYVINHHFWKRPPVGAMVVHRIPFTHPSHVVFITNCLRQQAVYNTLVASCVKGLVDDGAGIIALNDIQDENVVFEVTPHNLKHVAITFHHPTHPSMACLDVELIDHLKVKTALFLHKDAPPICPDSLPSEVLLHCMSIPFTMRAMFRKAWGVKSPAGTPQIPFSPVPPTTPPIPRSFLASLADLGTKPVLSNPSPTLLNTPPPQGGAPQPMAELPLIAPLPATARIAKPPSMLSNLLTDIQEKPRKRKSKKEPQAGKPAKKSAMDSPSTPSPSSVYDFDGKDGPVVGRPVPSLTIKLKAKDPGPTSKQPVGAADLGAGLVKLLRANDKPVMVVPERMLGNQESNSVNMLRRVVDQLPNVGGGEVTATVDTKFPLAPEQTEKVAKVKRKNGRSRQGVDPDVMRMRNEIKKEKKRKILEDRMAALYQGRPAPQLESSKKSTFVTQDRKDKAPLKLTIKTISPNNVMVVNNPKLKTVKRKPKTESCQKALLEQLYRPRLISSTVSSIRSNPKTAMPTLMAKIVPTFSVLKPTEVIPEAPTPDQVAVENALSAQEIGDDEEDKGTTCMKQAGRKGSLKGIINKLKANIGFDASVSVASNDNPANEIWVNPADSSNSKPVIPENEFRMSTLDGVPRTSAFDQRTLLFDGRTSSAQPRRQPLLPYPLHHAQSLSLSTPGVEVPFPVDATCPKFDLRSFTPPPPRVPEFYSPRSSYTPPPRPPPSIPNIPLSPLNHPREIPLSPPPPERCIPLERVEDEPEGYEHGDIDERFVHMSSTSHTPLPTVLLNSDAHPISTNRRLLPAPQNPQLNHQRSHMVNGMYKAPWTSNSESQSSGQGYSDTGLSLRPIGTPEPHDGPSMNPQGITPATRKAAHQADGLADHSPTIQRIESPYISVSCFPHSSQGAVLGVPQSIHGIASVGARTSTTPASVLDSVTPIVEGSKGVSSPRTSGSSVVAGCLPTLHFNIPNLVKTADLVGTPLNEPDSERGNSEILKPDQNTGNEDPSTVSSSPPPEESFVAVASADATELLACISRKKPVLPKLFNSEAEKAADPVTIAIVEGTKTTDQPETSADLMDEVFS